MHRILLFLLFIPLFLLAVTQSFLPEFALLEPLVYILLYAYALIFLIRGLFCRRIPKPVHVVLAAGCGIGALLVLAVAVAPLLDCPLPQGDEQAMLVLGAPDTTVLPDSRTDCADDFLTDHPELPVILCGAYGEAEGMADRLHAGNLLLETESTNTLENLQNAARLLSENGIGKDAPLVIVSSDFHLLRLKLYIQKEGFGNVRFVLAETPLTCKPVWVFREAVLLVRYFLLGR